MPGFVVCAGRCFSRLQTSSVFGVACGQLCHNGFKKIVKSLLNLIQLLFHEKKICLQNNLRSSETFQIRVQKDFNPAVSAIA